MTEGLVPLALAAGMVAALNPCGFALLPAYLSLLILDGAETSRPRAAVRALTLTAAMTVGFVAVFATFGLAILPVASSVQQYLPWVTVFLGLALVGAGGWLLAGRTLPVVGWHPRGRDLTRSVPSMMAFGVTYALASLTCTIAPFLAIVVSTLRSDSFGAGVTVFVAYALGMGLVVGTAAMAVAMASTTLVGRLRRSGRWVPRLAGALLVVVGAYVAYYGWWELRVLGGGTADDPVIKAAGRLQRAGSDAVTTIGGWGIAVALAALVLMASAGVWAGRKATAEG